MHRGHPSLCSGDHMRYQIELGLAKCKTNPKVLLPFLFGVPHMMFLKGLLLAQHSEITSDMLGEPYGMSGIKPRLDACMANAILYHSNPSPYVLQALNLNLNCCLGFGLHSAVLRVYFWLCSAELLLPARPYGLLRVELF